MTNNEAVEILEKMKYPQKVNKNGFIISNVNIENEALEMAISALAGIEQIRAELEDFINTIEYMGFPALQMKQALAIIEKYTKGARHDDDRS